MDLQRRKLNVARLSVLSNTALVVMKLAVGLMIGSVSIMSEAIHSGVDLLAAVIATFSVKTSGLPADTRHPFGHGKVENISGTIEAALIFLAAIWIIYEATQKLLHPAPIEYVSWGVVVMFISAVVNIIVSKMLFKVAKETDSIALEADAWHLRTDVYTSLGVMVSLALIWIGHEITPNPNIHWLDPVAAIGVALLILGTAYRLTVQSGRDLLDANLPAEEEWIRNLIDSYRPTIRGYHYLRTRKAGHMRFIEFHVQVDSQMTVRISHSLAQQLSSKIKEHFPHSTVTIHIEPCTGECSDKCLAGCFFTDTERDEMAVAQKQSYKKGSL